MDMDREKTRRTEHTVSLRAREGLEVRGVTDVISFDEQAVVLQTVCGTMTVEGASLHIHVLSMEEGIVPWTAESMRYPMRTPRNPIPTERADFSVSCFGKAHGDLTVCFAASPRVCGDSRHLSWIAL